MDDPRIYAHVTVQGDDYDGLVQSARRAVLALLGPDRHDYVIELEDTRELRTTGDQVVWEAVAYIVWPPYLEA